MTKKFKGHKIDLSTFIKKEIIVLPTSPGSPKAQINQKWKAQWNTKPLEKPKLEKPKIKEESESDKDTNWRRNLKPSIPKVSETSDWRKKKIND